MYGRRRQISGGEGANIRLGGKGRKRPAFVSVSAARRGGHVIDDVISRDDDDVINYARPADAGKSIVTTDIRRADDDPAAGTAAPALPRPARPARVRGAGDGRCVATPFRRPHARRAVSSRARGTDRTT